MKKIGGEIPLQSDGLFSYITDLGRSSLRLILHTLKDKKFALPDFLCPVIIDVFEEMGVKYKFYHVYKDLSSNFTQSDYDIIYVIRYFGQDPIKTDTGISDLILVEDCVFSPIVERHPSIKHWIGFNSFRKISPLTDGSIIKATFEFVDTRAYPKEIYNISRDSLFDIFNFYKGLENEKQIRWTNYLALVDLIKCEKLFIITDFPSFFPILVDRRDELREYLKTEDVFLPVHWPKHPKAPDNILYDRIISIPVDSRYDDKDMEMVAGLINGFYNV